MSVFTTARHRALSRTSWIKSRHSLYFSKTLLILSFLPWMSHEIHSGFRTKILYAYQISPQVLHPYPQYFSLKSTTLKHLTNSSNYKVSHYVIFSILLLLTLCKLLKTFRYSWKLRDNFNLDDQNITQIGTCVSACKAHQMERAPR
jgi:hypothetical protein